MNRDRWYGKKVKAKLSRHFDRRLDTVGLALVGDIKKELSQPGRGRLYTKGATKIRHRASAPGDPPAVDTGRLRQSIAHDRPNAETVRIGTNVKYAHFVEFGTINMKPRPFFRPVLQRMRKTIVRILKGTL